MSTRLLKTTWLYRQPKRKKTKGTRVKVKSSHKRHQKKKARLNKFANQLNENLPNSEKWFQSLFQDYKLITDYYNLPFCGFIPDLINKKYRYIIEIDGSIHNLPEIKLKDEKKESLYVRAGFTVYRIKAYDMENFNKVLIEVLKKRSI